MKARECAREGEVLQALYAGTLEGGLAGHAAACAVCREAVAVTRALWEAAPMEGEPPAAGLIWRRAELAARRELIEKSLAPIGVLEKAAAVVAVAAVVVASQWITTMPWWVLAGIPAVAFPAAGLLYLARKA
ncbi:MAG: hypothetical protein FJW20_03055 [Acidimicrobiia bacterium]|nr:hypothetical protein [Acidimicrobiia bacterium]